MSIAKRRLNWLSSGSVALGLSIATCVATAQPAPPAPPGTQPAGADAGKKPGPDRDNDKEKDKPIADTDKLSVTTHETTIGGQKVSYTATAGTYAIKDEEGKHKASFFFIAYEKKPADGAAAIDVAKRPVTFVFNGGPGSSSVWLHLGTVGPMRVDLPDNGVPGAPPSRLVENSESWLDLTDLVFIDPIGTGFSRPAPGEKGEQFWGVDGDLASVADFIRLYNTRNNRWASPKFLAGESYGTTRAAGLSAFLADRYGIAVNGIVLISTVLDFSTLNPGTGNDLPFALYLPSYAAIAMHHKKLAPELMQNFDATIKEVEAFAANDYLRAMIGGASVSPEKRKEVIAKLSRYTSLSEDAIDKSDLRIDPSFFRAKLLENERKCIGRFDGSLTGYDATPGNGDPDFDPSYSLYLPVYSTTINEYLRQTLKFESDLTYEVLTGRVRPWSFARGRFGGGGEGSGYLNVAQDLQRAMIEHPHLHVLVCSGWYDLATPFFAADYTVNQMNLSPELRKQITTAYFEGGHMMYHLAKSRAKLKENVKTLIESATKFNDR